MSNYLGGDGKHLKPLQMVMSILVFGSIWGFFEATLGGFLHLISFPYIGAIMGGLGIVIMGTALSIFRKPSLLPGIGIVAASFKLLNVWLLFVPINAIRIINPAMAIIVEACALYVIVLLLTPHFRKSHLFTVGSGILSGILSAFVYIYCSVYVTDPVPAVNSVATLQAFLANQGLIQTAMYGISFPLGLLIGDKFAFGAFTSRKQKSYYATSALIISLCWGISALAVLSF